MENYKKLSFNYHQIASLSVLLSGKRCLKDMISKATIVHSRVTDIHSFTSIFTMKHCNFTAQHMFLWRNNKRYPYIIFNYPPYLFYCGPDLCTFIYFSTICGARVRVEHSSGKVRPKPWLRGGGRGGGRGRKPFDPSDRCYQCGERGHYAYDCTGSSGSRSYSRRSSRYSRWVNWVNRSCLDRLHVCVLVPNSSLFCTPVFNC